MYRVYTILNCSTLSNFNKLYFRYLYSLNEILGKDKND